jgi:hypothetical protein
LQGRLDHIGGIPANVRGSLTDNVGAALEASRHLSTHGTQVAAASRDAFVSSMSSSLWVGVGLAAVAALVAFIHLPKQGTTRGGHAHGHGHAIAPTQAAPDIVALHQAATQP